MGADLRISAHGTGTALVNEREKGYIVSLETTQSCHSYILA